MRLRNGKSHRTDKQDTDITETDTVTWGQDDDTPRFNRLTDTSKQVTSCDEWDNYYCIKELTSYDRKEADNSEKGGYCRQEKPQRFWANCLDSYRGKQQVM